MDMVSQGSTMNAVQQAEVAEMSRCKPLVVRRVRVEVLRDGDSPRADGLDHEHVRLLAEVATPLPPITVHHPTMRVIDGMHRLAAARLNGQTYIDVTLFDGTRDEAFRLGVAANVGHGLPLSLAERRAAAARIVESAPALSDRSVARTTGLSAATVAAIRVRVVDHESEARIGADGRSRPLTAMAGRIAASRFIERRPDASVREIAREAGISVGTAHDVRRRVLAGEQPLPPAATAASSASAASSAGAKTADRQRPSATKDLEKILETLRQDPVMRYSDAGRSLLRWLGQHAISIDEWRNARDAAPAHCLERIALFAEECAKRWSAVADEISSI
jgi:ParB-like chromosome segregation protein Spo0J